MAKNQRTYNNEYKAQAMKLIKEIGGAKADRELYVPDRTIYGRSKDFRWETLRFYNLILLRFNSIRFGYGYNMNAPLCERNLSNAYKICGVVLHSESVCELYHKATNKCDIFQSRTV